MALNACDKLKRFNWTRLFRLSFILFTYFMHALVVISLRLYVCGCIKHTNVRYTHLPSTAILGNGGFTVHTHTGLLRLQQIYQGLRPGNESFQVETVKRIANVSNAINFLRTLETLNRWSRKFIVLDCSTEMAKEIIINHVRDISLGRRTFHYLLSGLVSSNFDLGYSSIFIRSNSYKHALVVGALFADVALFYLLVSAMAQ